MLIEAAKGGHTNVVSYLLDYPNNILSVQAPDLSQLTPPSQDASQVYPAKIADVKNKQPPFCTHTIPTYLFCHNRSLVFHSKLSLWLFPLRSPTEPHQTSQHPHLSLAKVNSAMTYNY